MLKETGPNMATQKAIEIYEKTEKTSYTKYPNQYIEKIRPKLKSCESAICDFVIRRTYGYHRPTAEITIDQFIDNCVKPGRDRGYSRRNIINAKNKLLETGLLGKIYNPNGSGHKGIYCVNIFYDKPTMPEPKNEIKELELAEAAADIFVPDQTLTGTTQNAYVDNYVQEAIPKTQETHEGPTKITTESSEQIAGANQTESRLDEAKNLTNSAHPECAHIVDHNLSLSQKNLKQTKQNWKSVCFDFCQRFGFDANSVYKTFNNLTKTYGLEYLNGKIRLVYDFAKNHKIANAIGFLVAACKRDFDLPLPLRQKLDARKKAEYEIVMSERRNAEILKIQEEQEQRQLKIMFAKERLPEGKFEEYIEKAKAFFAHVPFPVIENAITAKANEYLLADFQ